MIVQWIVCGLIAYLLGAIPTGYLVARAKGTDIRTVGSGNVGATNVLRSVGKGWGLFTLAADTLKGFLAAWLLPVGARHLGFHTGGYEMGLMCAALAVAGHDWPVFLGFKGGKGVATSAGALAGIAPPIVALGFCCWLIVFILTRYVSLASMTAAAAISIASWFLYYPVAGPILPVAFTLLGTLLIARHRSNIKRLVHGQESRISFQKNRTG